MNRAVSQTRFGCEPVDALELIVTDKPRAAPGRVIVKLRYSPVHPYDLVLIRTCQLAHLRGRNAILGCEGVGIVEEVGTGVTKVKPGQRVAAAGFVELIVNGQGCWQDYCDMSEKYVFPVPENFTDEAACQMLLNPATIYGILEDIHVPTGEYLLQTAAGSVLGRQLIQLAKHRGINTINIVRRDDLKEELKALGGDEVINSVNEDVVARVREITGGKLAYGSLDAVAGSLTKTVMASTRDGGNVFIYGALGGSDVLVDCRDLARKVKLSLWRMADYVKKEQQDKLQQFFQESIKLQEEKVMEPLVGEKFSFSDFKKAIEASEKPGRGGKVIVVN
eukprot:c25336_g1_i1 orf=42-1046(-)